MAETMNTTLYIALISLFFTLLLFSFLNFCVRQRVVAFCAHSTDADADHSTYEHTLRNIQEIIYPHGSSLQPLLDERAYANKRLVRALGLTNTFVSEDKALHAKFVSRAQALLNSTKKNGWAHFQSIARDAVHWQQASSELQHADAEYPFDKAVQNITLYVVLEGILQVEGVASLSYEDVDAVASSITKLWALSKKPEPIPPYLLADLTLRLRRLVPDEEQYPAPLDFIVPTWETLWRVVATAVAYSHNSDDIQQAFQTFNSCPKDDVYRGSGENTAISVRNVMTETLRLNPPSKRIGRAKVPAPYPSFVSAWIPRTMVKADIGALLHGEIWGADITSFLPTRHISGQQQQQDASALVFGHGPLRCIAASWAPVAAAVIAGVVLDEYTVLPGKSVGEREGWQGWRLMKKNSIA